ncbi:MAG: methyltransferase domain-containing protein [Candidatus Micrarchaeota archaeon]
MSTNRLEFVCPACLSSLAGGDDLLKCKKCNANYHVVDRIPQLISGNFSKNEAEIQDAAGEDYDNIRYARSYSRAYHDWWSKQIVEYLSKTDLVLDDGCGTGELAAQMPSEDVVGVDISMGMCFRASKKMHQVLNANSEQLPFRDCVFDAVICRGHLHHLPRPEKGISEVSRVLREGGKAIFSEPISSILSTLPRRISRNSGHFSETHKAFNRTEFLSMIEDSALKISEVRYFGYLAYPLIGFPDVFDLFKYMPFGASIAPLLIKLDEHISHIPGVKRHSWAVLVIAHKE